jgi:hypothetical protein
MILGWKVSFPAYALSPLTVKQVVLPLKEASLSHVNPISIKVKQVVLLL